MKRSLFAAIIGVALLTACASPSAVTVYADEHFSVTRAGAYTYIVDVATGEQYTFVTRRVKRPQNAAEAAERPRMKTTADTDTLTIRNAYNVITVTVNTTGETYLFRE